MKHHLTLHLTLLGTMLAGGCTAADADPDRDIVTDSAGIALVTSPATTRPLGWVFTEELRLGGADTGAASFTGASHGTVATNGTDRIFVFDRDASAIQAFSGDGRALATMGGAGEGPGELSFAFELVDVGPGRVGVFDFGKTSLLQWDESGTLLDEGPVTTGAGGWDRLALRGDTLYMGQTLEDSVRTLSTLKRMTPTDTAILAQLVTAPRAMIEFSCFMARVPPLFTPVLVWSTRGPWLAVARQDRYAIDLYRDGELVRSFRRPIEGTATVPEDVARQNPDGMRVRFGSGPGCTIPVEELSEKQGMADILPVIHRLAFGPDGTLWVERHTFPGEAAVVDVFNLDGGYIGTDVGRGLPLGELSGGRVLFALPDSSTGLTQVGVHTVDRPGSP